MGIVVAVEGPDLAGKTTFIDRLRETPQMQTWPVFKPNYPSAVLVDTHGTEIERISRAWGEGQVAMKQAGLSFILDRCYVSSYVYSLVLKRTYDLEYVKDLADRLNPWIVYLSTPADLLLQRWEYRGDRMHSRLSKPEMSTRLMALHQTYEEWAARNPFHDRVIKVNWEAQQHPLGVAEMVGQKVVEQVRMSRGDL